MSATIDSSISLVPVPSLALAKTASSVEIPTMSSISFFTLSGSAEGRSILFYDGDELKPGVGGQIGMGKRLGLNSLGGVNDQ